MTEAELKADVQRRYGIRLNRIELAVLRLILALHALGART